MNKADPVFNYSKPGPDLAKRAGFNRVWFRVPGRAIMPSGQLKNIRWSVDILRTTAIIANLPFGKLGVQFPRRWKVRRKKKTRLCSHVAFRYCA